MKKVLVIGVVLLFLNLAAIETVHCSAATSDSVHEVTVEACGLPGYKATTVRLTSEKIQSLDAMFVNWSSQFLQVRTTAERNRLCGEITSTLHSLGLLPRGMTERQVERLISSRLPYQVTGHAKNSYIVKFPLFTPFSLVGIITFGSMTQIADGPVDYSPSTALVYVIHNGVNTSYEGNLYGTLGGPSLGFWCTQYYNGIRGFCGLKISDYYCHFIGSARQVGISYHHPG